MTTRERTEARASFAKTVAKMENKIQIGARGSKIAPDWIAIDLFDTSHLIDHNWDIQDLPLQDNTVDCYVCNAILEHVPNPDLAIYEMHRTLKVGGNIWVEVPFLQFYHAHPNDFLRWTLPGIRRWMQDFDEVRAGVTEWAGREAGKFFEYLHVDAKETVPPDLKHMVIEFVEGMEKKIVHPRMYGGVFFWGRKNTRPISQEKSEYMLYLKRKNMREWPR
jgi:predicted SAM-dependent methyltransferase